MADALKTFCLGHRAVRDGEAQFKALLSTKRESRNAEHAKLKAMLAPNAYYAVVRGNERVYIFLSRRPKLPPLSFASVVEQLESIQEALQNEDPETPTMQEFKANIARSLNLQADLTDIVMDTIRKLRTEAGTHTDHITFSPTPPQGDQMSFVVASNDMVECVQQLDDTDVHMKDLKASMDNQLSDAHAMIANVEEQVKEYLVTSGKTQQAIEMPLGDERCHFNICLKTSKSRPSLGLKQLRSVIRENVTTEYAAGEGDATKLFERCLVTLAEINTETTTQRVTLDKARAKKKRKMSDVV